MQTPSSYSSPSNLPPGDSRCTAIRGMGLAWLLIAATVGGTLGRIATVRSPGGETPFLSANDRSRWAAIRAFGDTGAFEIDEIIRETDPETGERTWSTIDRVRHHGPDGSEHDYSSKPPLMGIVLGGEYWIIKQITGQTAVKCLQSKGIDIEKDVELIRFNNTGEVTAAIRSGGP